MNEAEQKLKRGLAEAKESLKKELHDAFTGAKEALRANTLGKVEDIATNLGDKMNNTRDTLVDTIRNNPVPATVMGVGLVWLLMNRSKAAPYRAQSAAGQNHGSSDGRRFDESRSLRNNGGDQRFTRDGQDTGEEVIGQIGGAIAHAGSGVGRAAHQASEAVGHGLHQASDAAGKVLHGASEGAMTLAHGAADTASHLAHQAGDAASSVAGSARKGAKRVEDGFQHTLQENPVALGVAALAVGAVVGFSLPRTHGEDVLMGETRDGVLHRAGDAVYDATTSIAHFAEQNLQQAKIAVKEPSEDAQQGEVSASK